MRRFQNEARPEGFVGRLKIMHYKNGREAKNGDKIILIQSGGFTAAGILYDAKAEAGSDCNGRIAAMTYNDQWADLKNCLHIDDVVGKPGPEDIAVKAARMYDAYCAAVGGVAFNGDRLPDWNTFRSDESKAKQSNAWIEAALAVQ